MDNLQATPITMCLGKVTLAAGSTTTISNTGTMVFAIRGKAYSHAAWTNQATPTTDWATGNAFIPIPIPLSSPNIPSVPNGQAGYSGIFMVGLSADGTMRVIQGSIVGNDGNTTTPVLAQALSFNNYGPSPGTTQPANYNDFCPVGYIIVSLDNLGVATWTFGTNNLSSVTGAHYTFVDVVGWTDRPQTS